MKEPVSVGFCRLDMTPPLGVRMSGYYQIRLAEGILDPLYVNALAFGEGDRCAVVLVCDLCGIFSSAAYEWPHQIAEKLQIPKQCVFLCHTHIHTGPVVMGDREPSDPQYDEWLFRRLCDAAAMALADRKPVVRMEATESTLQNRIFTRRFRMKDGHYQNWPGYRSPEIDCPAGPVDESFRIVRIFRENAPELAIVNTQVHPDMVGGCLYSADFPGVLRNTVESRRPGVRCVFLNGAEGQLIGVDFQNGPEVRLVGAENARIFGRALSEAVLQVYDSTRPISAEGLRFDQQTVIARTKWDPALIPEARRLIALHEAGRDSEIGPSWYVTPVVGEAYKLVRLDKNKVQEAAMLVTAVTVGGLALLGFPGEPFCELGMHLRSASPYEMTFVCCQVNGCFSYYPIKEAFDQGGYEPRNTQYVRGTAEQLAEAGEAMLNRLHG